MAALRTSRNSAAFLDIETTGLGGTADHMTTVVIYDGRPVSHFIHGRNLMACPLPLQKYRLQVTFNGRCFDVPFIEPYLGYGSP
jgi:uncharacterized protein YprB with RNaseH-like and TPR domain